MSKILLEKINNILEIDKTKEYINLSNVLNQDEYKNDYLNLCQILSAEQLDGLLNNSKSELIFCNQYQEILDYIKNINDYNTLVNYLNEIGLEDLDVSYANVQFSTNNINYKNQEELEFLNLEKTTLEQESFLYFKKAIYEQVKKRLLINTKVFEQLDKKAKQAFINTGKQLLRVATCFLQGHINSNYINAPLFLYDAEIEIKENVVTIIRKNELILNEKVLIFILKELDIDYRQWDLTQIRSYEDITTKLKEIIFYEIQTEDVLHGIGNELDIFRTLKCINNIYLGLFDVKPSKLKEDFINLINQNVDLFNQKMNHDYEYYTKQEFKQKALVQINHPLNIYQKYALRSAINENTLIYGPPGTGKSEIIASIIANLLVLEKSILVVSEKDAALSVIKHRLMSLQHFCFYLKDIEDETTFYDQINWISQFMGSFYNEEYKNETFDLTKQYEHHDHVIDYNLLIEKFRNILNEDINFSIEKDSRNNDYRDYLLATNEVNHFIEQNSETVNSFYEEYKNKFVKLQTPVEFIAKVAEYNDFREHYELSEQEINRFEQIRSEINKFFAKYDIILQHKLNYEKTIEQLKLLEDFLNLQLLNKDKDFLSAIKNDANILTNNYKYWTEINDLLKDFKNSNQIKKFLINNIAKHEKFLNKYVSSSKSEQTNLINRYFYKREISNKKLLFKSIKKYKDFDTIFIQCLQLMNKIKSFKNNNYLDQLIKLDKQLISNINLFFYTNEELIKKPIFEFYNKEIVNFDNRIIKQYYKYRINQIERELVNINVYRYEKILKNKHIIERDLNYEINKYIKNNQDFILQLDKAIKDLYLKFIKQKLSQASNEIQEKTKKMFQIVNLEVKPKINDFIIEFIDCLRIIFPIWVSKPELISFYTKNEKEIFDVGIFDEASQMFLEKAYPILYRCKQVIIAGDDQQLKPERLIFNELILDPNYRPLVKEVEFDYSESLLDRTKVSYWNAYHLKNHYRSLQKELIEFSNDHFYNNELLYSSKNNIHELGLEIYDVNGNQTQNINELEAEWIIYYLDHYINIYEKIIVICFTKQQANHVIKLIKEKTKTELLIKIKRQQLIIGDIYSVQGDESSLVMISCVFDHNAKEYGSITKPRGKNSLNVAITRAKAKLIVFKSLVKDDIKLDIDDQYDDTKIFKQWIGYLDNKLIEQTNQQTINLKETYLSNFKKEVYKTLKTTEWFNQFNILQNLNIGTCNIDLAFYRNDVNDIDLVVILDDWKKNISIQSWFEDIDQQEYLLSRNYKILRIREQEWLQDKYVILDKLYELLNPLLTTNSS